MTNTPQTRTHAEEAAWTRQFIGHIIDECPRRSPTSESEKRAHAIIAGEYHERDLDVEQPEFRFNENIFHNIALHFGLSVAATVVAVWNPIVALCLHLLVAVSYTADSTRKGFLLRRLLPWGWSRNVVGTRRATTQPRLRLVFVSHADATFTGLLFQPHFVRRFGAKPGPLYKSLRIAVLSVVLLACVDIALLVVGPSPLLLGAAALLTLPSLFALVLNLDIVFRNTVVPGANDNLSGVAGTVLLADRLAGRVPSDVELVFVATGCEESSLGGADALERWASNGRWQRENTIVIGVDGLTNGELRWFEEGEIFPVGLDAELVETLKGVSASDARFAQVRGFDIPVGGTDAIPFLVRGWRGVTLGCLDPALGMPRGYHTPADNLENLEADGIPVTLDYVELFVQALVKKYAPSS